MHIDLKIIKTTNKRGSEGTGEKRIRRSETTVSIPLNDNPPMDVLKALWNFEQAVNAHSSARIHVDVREGNE